MTFGIIIFFGLLLTCGPYVAIGTLFGLFVFLQFIFIMGAVLDWVRGK